MKDRSQGEVSLSIAEERMNICKSCEHFIFKKTVCSKCGCLMALKTKIRGSSCPVGKWKPVQNK